MRHRHLSLLLRCGVGLLAIPRGAGAVPLHVAGTASVDATASFDGARLEIAGRVADDRGAPLRGGNIRAVVRELGGRVRSNVTLDGCPGAAKPRATAGEISQAADDMGAFCFTVSPSATTDVVTVRFQGDEDHEHSPAMPVPILTGQRRVTLTFSPEPRRLELDAESLRVWVRAEAVPASSTSEEIEVELLRQPAGGSAIPLARQVVRCGERAAIQFEGISLGLPGRDVLMARWEGSADLAPASRRIVVAKTIRVSLAVIAAPEAADPRGGVSFEISALSRLGPVPGGGVEIAHDGQTLGVAPVIAGLARPIAYFDAPPGEPVHVTARYLPDAPWWIPGDTIPIVVGPPPHRPWRGWPWVLAGAALAAWAIHGWRRPPKRLRAPLVMTRPPPPGRPSVAMVARGPQAAGWRGVVLDAHDGTPIRGAQVSIVSPSFAALRLVSLGVTDASGRFELAAGDASAEGTRLEVSAEWHSTLARPVPAAGELVVSLVTRRRSAIDRLVAWAERIGRPWTASADPTPGEIANVARGRGAAAVENWARSVETAAFGADPVDAERERLLAAAEPRQDIPPNGSR